ncbi:Fe-S cluster assembly transcriptional regulator IscR [Chromatiales bacterium (ex Bugula neritina AB1)]|nr:Fe-S cluster assembly transcriptional regulator IscR [Chromatiales bacterium (ex Bugula neritina AB1)]
MKLTTRGRYAVTAMLDLALHSSDGPVSLADISGRQEISLSYLEQLFSRLRRHELVASTRGPGGGYRVARPLAQVAVADIVLAVNESVDATQCGGQKNCHQHGRCLTHDLWEGLSQQVEAFLSGISLHDLINREPVKRVAEIQNNRVVFHDQDIIAGRSQRDH